MKRWVQRLMRRLINFYPPFLGAGIRVTRMDLGADLGAGLIEARMKLTWWNRNYVGTHYGGSLYSLCDPFHLLILIEGLGPGYVLWDKAARIRFIRPGRGTVRVRIEVSREEVETLRQAVDAEGRSERTFRVQIEDLQGRVVADVEKVIYVRRKEDADG